MKKVNIYEAKTRLSQLVEEAAAGHDIVIARAGRPVARLTRLAEAGRPSGDWAFSTAGSASPTTSTGRSRTT